MSTRLKCCLLLCGEIEHVGSPTTLTADEQALVLRVTTSNDRDHRIISLAPGTGLRLAEIVGRDVGDVFAPDGTPRVRVRIRKEIPKGGRAADVFLPDRLVAKLKKFSRWKQHRDEDLTSDAPLFANQSRRRISKLPYGPKTRTTLSPSSRATKSGFRDPGSPSVTHVKPEVRQ